MNFNQALERAAAIVKGKLPDLQEDVIIVRDLHGRIRVLLESANPQDKPRKPFKRAFKSALKDLSRDLSADLGDYAYAKTDVLLFSEDLPNLALPNAASAPVLDRDAGYTVCLHDRLLIGTEWNVNTADAGTHPTRITFYSMKGGVGRSTTVAVVAWSLAQAKKKVLVIDLDLESPGVGSMLVPISQLPDYGVVDWFVEDALGQAGAVESAMVATSPLSLEGTGEVHVVPAFGKETGDYLPKLGRVYLERGPQGPESWANRLQRMVTKLEQQVGPDVVLLDSRTGLHDTSAALIMAMGAHTLLFAVDSQQTWSAYQHLFKHWKSHPSVIELRERLWLVASMVTDDDGDGYLRGFRDSAHDLFSILYDADEDSDFSFSLQDQAAPHSPTDRHIRWTKALQTFDPTSSLEAPEVEAAYRSFLQWFNRVLLPKEESR